MTTNSKDTTQHRSAKPFRWSSKAAKAPGIAKLTRPRLHAVIERTRVFEELDVALAHPVVWLAAQPGTGKTTLIATWLEARTLPDLWFQVDSGDADPATFLLYLARCVEARNAPRKSQTLPLLTPEHQADLPAFGRRFFREMFACLPADSANLMDNFQELPEDCALHEALVSGMAEVPVTATLVVISRLLPSARYARLAANRALTVISWERLRLTLDETRAIVTSSNAAASLAERLHAQSDGWAAGLRLMQIAQRHLGQQVRRQQPLLAAVVQDDDGPAPDFAAGPRRGRDGDQRRHRRGDALALTRISGVPISLSSTAA